MKSHEFITEIERLRPTDYEGGKSDIETAARGKKRKLYRGAKPLPGTSGLQYAISHDPDGYSRIFIIDPNTQDLAGKLTITKAKSLPGNVYQVGSITVDEGYRGYGIAKALYGVVLAIMKVPLAAGESQTPGGRRNWLSLSQIPGVEVMGYARIADSSFKANPNAYSSWEKNEAATLAKFLDAAMNAGGQYWGKKQRYGRLAHYFLFPVTQGEGEMAPDRKSVV
jgi:hypothetical protein